LQLKNIQKKPPFTLMSLVYHIHANSKDAMMALGYVHADRLCANGIDAPYRAWKII
jgi:hypothetical protein